jgi:hypothetical protein
MQSPQVTPGQFGAAAKLHLVNRTPPCELPMFGFYSNQLGCLGSLIVSLIGTVILILVLRSCSG